LYPFLCLSHMLRSICKKGEEWGLELGGNRVAIGRQSYVRNYAIFAWYLRLVCSFVRLSAARCFFNCIKDGFRSWTPWTPWPCQFPNWTFVINFTGTHAFFFAQSAFHLAHFSPCSWHLMQLTLIPQYPFFTGLFMYRSLVFGGL